MAKARVGARSSPGDDREVGRAKGGFTADGELVLQIKLSATTIDAEPDYLREIASEYAELATYSERQGQWDVAMVQHFWRELYEKAAPVAEEYQAAKNMTLAGMKRSDRKNSKARVLVDCIKREKP